MIVHAVTKDYLRPLVSISSIGSIHSFPVDQSIGSSLKVRGVRTYNITSIVLDHFVRTLPLVGFNPVAIVTILILKSIYTTTATRSNRGIKSRAERGLVINCPVVVQRELGLMVEVVAGSKHLTIKVTILKVHTSAIGVVIVLRLEMARRTLIVPLRSTKSGKRKGVCLIDLLRDVEEVAIPTEVCCLYVTITIRSIGRSRDSPTILHQTGREIEAVLYITIVTNPHKDIAAFFSISVLGYDINSPPHRGDTEARSSETALYLHHRRYIRKSSPVAPIHLTAFHIVYRYPIDKYPEVVGIETTHHNARIPKTTSGTSNIHRRSGLKKLRELCVKGLGFNLFEGNIAHRHGHFAILRHHRSNHFYLTKAHSVGSQQDFPKLYSFSSGAYFIQNNLIVTNATNRNLGTMRYIYTELTIEVGGHPPEGRSLPRSYRCSNNGSIILSIQYLTGHHNLGKGHSYPCYHKRDSAEQTEYILSHSFSYFLCVHIFYTSTKVPHFCHVPAIIKRMNKNLPIKNDDFLFRRYQKDLPF